MASGFVLLVVSRKGATLRAFAFTLRLCVKLIIQGLGHLRQLDEARDSDGN